MPDLSRKFAPQMRTHPCQLLEQHASECAPLQAIMRLISAILRAVQVLVDAGARMDELATWGSCFPLLLLAAVQAQLVVMRTLITRGGVSPSVQDSKGHTTAAVFVRGRKRDYGSSWARSEL